MKTIVEMPSPWKPQTGFHSDLEISRAAREIPTFPQPIDGEHTGTRTQEKVSPMYPVCFVTDVFGCAG
jgi:hypothetical protein